MSSIVYPLLGESVLSEGGTGSLRNSFLYKYRGDGTGEIIIELNPGESYVASVSGDQNEALNKWLSDVNLIPTIITNLANTYNGSKVEIADPIIDGYYRDIITPLSVSEIRDVYWKFGPGAPYSTLPIQPGTTERQAQFVFEAPTTYYVSIDNGVQASDTFTHKAYMRRVTSWDFDTSTPTEAQYQDFLDKDFAYSSTPAVGVIGQYGFDEPVYGRLYKVKIKGLPTWIDNYLESSIIDQFYQLKNAGASPPYAGPYTEEDLIYIPIIANVFTEEIEDIKLTKSDRNEIVDRIKGQIDVFNQCLSGQSADFSNIDPLGNRNAEYIPDVIGLDKDGNQVRLSDGKSFLDLIDHGIALPYRFKLMQKMPVDFIYPFFSKNNTGSSPKAQYNYSLSGFGTPYLDTRKSGVDTIASIDPRDVGYTDTETINGIEVIDCGYQGSILFYDYDVWKNKNVTNLVARHSLSTTTVGSGSPVSAAVDMFRATGALILSYSPYSTSSSKLVPLGGTFGGYTQVGKIFAGTNSPITYDTNGLKLNYARALSYNAISAQLNSNAIGQTTLHEFVHAIGWAGHTHHATAWSHAKESVGTNLRTAYFKTPFTPEFPYIDSDGNERTMSLDWQDNESDWNTYAELIYSLPERYDIFNNKIKLKNIPQAQYITTTETETTTQIIAGETKQVGDDHEGGIIVHIDHENQRSLIASKQAAPRQISVFSNRKPLKRRRKYPNSPSTVKQSVPLDLIVNELYGGKNNTDVIIEQVVDLSEPCFYKELADGITVEGYNDWYIPCRAEIEELRTIPNYIQKFASDIGIKLTGVFCTSNTNEDGASNRWIYVPTLANRNYILDSYYSGTYNSQDALLFRIGSYPQGDQTIVTTEEIEVEIENPEYDSTLLETENTLTYESINIREKISEAIEKAPLFLGVCNKTIDGNKVNVINPTNADGTRRGPNITVKIPFCDAEDNTKYDFDWWLNFGFLDPEKPSYPNDTPIEDILSSDLCPCLYLPQRAEDSGYDTDLTVIDGEGKVTTQFMSRMDLLREMVSENFIVTSDNAASKSVKHVYNSTGKVFRSTSFAPPTRSSFENIIKTLNNYKVYNSAFFVKNGLWTGISPSAHMPYKYRQLDKKLDTTSSFNRAIDNFGNSYDTVELSDYEKEFIDSCKFNEDPSGLARGTSLYFGNMQEQSEGIEYALLYTIGSSNPSDDTYNPFRRDEFFTDPEYWGSIFGVATSAGFTKTQGVEFYDGVIDINYQLSAVKYMGAPIVFKQDSNPNDLLAQYLDDLPKNYTDAQLNAYTQSLPMYNSQSFPDGAPGYPSIYSIDSRVIINRDAALFFDLLVKKKTGSGFLKGIRLGELLDLKNREYTQLYSVSSNLQNYIEIIETYIDNYMIDGVVVSNSDVVGCGDQAACNYDPDATITNSVLANCIYPDVAYVDCNGNCINDSDGDGVCDEEDFCVGDIDNCGRCVAEDGYQINSCAPTPRTIVKTCVKDFLNVEEIPFLCQNDVDFSESNLANLGITNIDGGELVILTSIPNENSAQLAFLEGFEPNSYWVKTPDLSTEEWENIYYNAFNTQVGDPAKQGFYNFYQILRRSTYDCPGNPYVAPSAANGFKGGGGCLAVHDNTTCEYGTITPAQGCVIDKETDFSLEELSSIYGLEYFPDTGRFFQGEGGNNFINIGCSNGSNAVLIGLSTSEGIMFNERGEEYSGEFFYQSNASFYSGTPTNVGERLYPRNELLRKNLIAITKVDKIVEDFRKVKDKINKICTFTNRK